MKILRITTVPQTIRAFLIVQVNLVESAGFDIRLVSSEGEEDWRIIEKHTHIPCFIIPMARGISLWGDIKSFIGFIRLIRREKPKIVHTMTPKAGLLGMIAAKICGVPVRIHDVVGMVQQSKSGILFHILDIMERITYFCAHEIIPNSYSLRDYILEREMTNKKKVKILGRGSSHGINLSKFSISAINATQLAEIKHSISYDENCRYLLTVGRMVKDKGINELVEGFKVLNQKYDNLRLILLGPFEPELDPLLPSTLYEINNNNNIIHIHFSKYVECFLYVSDVLVHASYREGLPNVLLEAGAMKCPIVCSTATGNIDIVQHEQTGLLFKIANKEDLIDKISYALNNKSSMEKYSENLYQIIQTYFSNEMVNQFVVDNYLYHKLRS